MFFFLVCYRGHQKLCGLQYNSRNIGTWIYASYYESKLVRIRMGFAILRIPNFIRIRRNANPNQIGIRRIGSPKKSLMHRIRILRIPKSFRIRQITIFANPNLNRDFWDSQECESDANPNGII